MQYGDFSVDNIFVKFGGCLLRQVIGEQIVLHSSLTCFFTDMNF